MHITQTKRWKFWKEKCDEFNKKCYDSMYPVYKYISPKEKKANYLASLKGWNKKDLMKLKSKQLGAIKNENKKTASEKS